MTCWPRVWRPGGSPIAVIASVTNTNPGSPKKHVTLCFKAGASSTKQGQHIQGIFCLSDSLWQRWLSTPEFGLFMSALSCNWHQMTKHNYLLQSGWKLQTGCIIFSISQQSKTRMFKLISWSVTATSLKLSTQHCSQSVCAVYRSRCVNVTLSACFW